MSNYIIMKKINYLLAIILTTVFYVSCSSDDVQETPNQFIIEGKNYPMESIFVEKFTKHSRTTILLHLLNITEQDIEAAQNSGVALTEVDFFSIAVRDENLTSKTYTTNSLWYEFMTDGEFLGEYDNEQLLMEYENGDEVTLTINSINETNISLDFKVKRVNGSVATGSYKGKYSVIEESSGQR